MIERLSMAEHGPALVTLPRHAPSAPLCTSAPGTQPLLSCYSRHTPSPSSGQGPRRLLSPALSSLPQFPSLQSGRGVPRPSPNKADQTKSTVLPASIPSPSAKRRPLPRVPLPQDNHHAIVFRSVISPVCCVPVSSRAPLEVIQRLPWVSCPQASSLLGDRVWPLVLLKGPRPRMQVT
jgi:hypothetical protein